VLIDVDSNGFSQSVTFGHTPLPHTHTHTHTHTSENHISDSYQELDSDGPSCYMIVGSCLYR